MKYFKLSEFKCPCCGENKISKELVQKFENARELAGVPFVITSGYRCKNHNKEIGGSPTSSHSKGLAADIKCNTSRERFKIIQTLLLAGFTRIGVGKNFIHCDIDKEKDSNVLWLY